MSVSLTKLNSVSLFVTCRNDYMPLSWPSTARWSKRTPFVQLDHYVMLSATECRWWSLVMLTLMIHMFLMFPGKSQQPQCRKIRPRWEHVEVDEFPCFHMAQDQPIQEQISDLDPLRQSQCWWGAHHLFVLSSSRDTFPAQIDHVWALCVCVYVHIFTPNRICSALDELLIFPQVSWL